MGITVGVNNLSVIHKKSSGVTIAFPDICLTPIGSGTVPIPYPNMANSGDTADGSKTVKCDGESICLKNSNFKTSSGDEAGANKGIGSGKIKGKAEFVNFSFDVQVEGKNVPRAFDLMLHNAKNTPPVPVIQKPIVSVIPEVKPKCLICNKAF